MPIELNYPGPYELRIFYTSLPAVDPVLQHIQRLNIAMYGSPTQGDDFGNMYFSDKNGAHAVTLDTLVEDYLAVFNALFAATMTIDQVELWKYPTVQSFESVYWATYTPTANVGTAGGSNGEAVQDITTFRTQEGGIMKTSLMENVATPGLPKAYANMSATKKALVDFILDGDGATYSAPFLGRDTSYPVASIKNFPGQNEATWKKRNGR